MTTDDQQQEIQRELERLREENEQLKSQKKRSTTNELSLKVSQKGAVSLYGMGRFPVTLYKEQWLRLLGHEEHIRQFISDNESDLKSKN